MRQGQQNRRGRGRTNNRKGGHHNPLARSFESNGPNERIRGTPSHIAEKYASLAREAQSSGDPVLAENYLQHAEHYSRIIMAYREQFNQPGDGMNGGGQRMRGPGDVGESIDDMGEEPSHETTVEDGFPQPVPPPGPAMQRPHGGGEHGRQDRPFRREQNRPRYNDRSERPAYGDRERQADVRPEPQDRAQEQAADGGGEHRRRDRIQQAHEQPEFLRRPVRRVRSENGEPGKNEPSLE